MLNQPAIPKIVLLKNDYASTHAVRQAIRRAGLASTLDLVTNREELFSSLDRGAADLLIVGANGFDGNNVAEIVKDVSIAGQEIPVVVVGDDSENLEGAQSWREEVSDYVRISQLERLPAVLDRVLRTQRHRNVNARVQGELDRAAEILRENQKMITIGRLTASIAHEINNPLESITNLLYLMEVDRESPGKWESYLHQAQRELNRVISISKQTLTFSRETSVPARVHLADLMEEVLGLYSRRIVEKNLRITRQFSSSEPVTVFPGEMRQVLSNLIANAIEATSPGGALRLRIRPARNWSDQGVRGVRLSVADDGMGMSAEVRSRLGEPFFTTKGQHGTGLGLWVTRSILNRYGGSLSLRSSVAPDRHGTVFSMFLPTNMRPQAVQPPGEAAPSPAHEPGRTASRSAASRNEHENDGRHETNGRRDRRFGIV